MNTFHIIVLAVLQGLTEFIPVSSSGHLVIFSEFMSENLSAEDINSVIIFLHFGTLFAVIFHFRKILLNIVYGLWQKDVEVIKLTQNIIITCIPVFIFGSIFSIFIETSLSRDAQFYIATFSLIIAGSLFALSPRFIKDSDLRKLKSANLSKKQSLIIGIFQSFGVIYGVSRSGITLLGSRFQGMSNKDSLDYTFLVSIPVLIGASLFTLLSDGANALELLSFENLLLGIVISGITGYFAISFLLNFLKNRTLRSFGIYCMCFGILSLLLHIFI